MISGAKKRKVFFAVLLLLAGLAAHIIFVAMHKQSIAGSGITTAASEINSSQGDSVSTNLSNVLQPFLSANSIATNDLSGKSAALVKETTSARVPKQVADVLEGVHRFSDVFAELTSTPIERLTHDELAVLRYVVVQCDSVAAQKHEIESCLFKNDKAAPQRLAAAKSLLNACSRVNASDEQMSAIESEFSKRQHAGGRTLAIAASASTGNSTDATKDIEHLLSTTDMLTKYRAFSSIFDVAGSVETSTSNGMKPTSASDLSESWTLALCELAGTCGTGSPDVLWACVKSNQCGAASPEDLIKKFDAALYDRMVEIKAQMLQSLESHNWNWLSIFPATQKR
jgi:hypothetical protein